MANTLVTGVVGLIVGGALVFGYTQMTAQPEMEETMESAGPAISADDAYAARNAAMKAIAGHMKALGAVAKGEATADAGTLVHAVSLNELAQTVPLLFDVESIAEKSRAKGEIWSDWAGFLKVSGDFANATAGVVAAAESGDAAAIGAALGGVGATCGGCHKPYRGPEK